ncbi:MAG: TonB-dependent receptor [Bacteroidales bacterium]|nr:TonB-dependent receptor [Bacteroidales bacterium]
MPFVRIFALLLTMLLSSSIMFGQTRTVTGQVIDQATGEPVIGANVLIKGTTTGTITDIDGNFSLSGVTDKSVLHVSYVGYTAEDVPVKGNTNLNIVIHEDNDLLDEVVVVGYGVQKKRDLTGAISSVKADDIKVAPVMNAMEGLQGKIAGLDITRESGAAGTSPTLLLRGNRSLDGSNSPLFVIDGVSGGSIANLNPNDIESIEVLKDASSTAIYGSAGANGVIIVTTKQGTRGKVTVDFNSYMGLNCMPAYPETYTGEDWINYMATGYEVYYGNSVWNEYPNRSDALARLFNEYKISNDGLDCYNQGKFINWKDEILKTGVQQNYSLSVRGGNDKTQSYASFGWQNEEGMYRNDNYKQLTFRAGTTFEANRYISIGFQSSLSYKDRNKRNSRLSKTLNEMPLGEVYEADGSLKRYPTGSSDDYTNIMADDIPGQYKNTSRSTSINITPFVEIRPLKGLSFKTLVNTSVSTSRSGSFEGLYTYYKLTGSSQDVGIRTASITHNDSWGIQWQNILNYNIKIGKAHDITATGIIEYNRSHGEYAYAYNRGFDYDSYTFYNLGGGLQPKVDSEYSQTKMLSYAARLNYSLLGRYLFSATMRWDGASQLYNQWDSFPSASFGWRISDEPWMEGTNDWLDNLKLRVGYGVTGNSNIAPYSSKTLVETSANQLNLGGGQVQSYILTQAVANYNLGWEKSYNINVGLDFSIFKGRLDASIDYYNTDTKDVLYKRQLPTSYGLYNAKSPYTMMSNVARIKNDGIEVSLNTRNIVTRDFVWSSTVTFAKNNERLTSIDLGNNTTVDELISLGLFLDNPVYTYYNYKKNGIWQNGQEDQAACFGLQPGQVIIATDESLKWDPNYQYTGYVRDRITNAATPVERHGAYYIDNEDGTRTYYRQGTPQTEPDGSVTIVDENFYPIGAEDKKILGHKQPDFTIGWTNNFTYRWFDLSIMTVMRWGQMVNGDLLGYVGDKNQPVDFDYWTPNNPTNAFPLAKLGVSNEAKTALLYVDGSFIKIKNITLGYRVPQKLLRKAHMSQLRFYGTVQNPFIFCKDDMLKGLDPENTSSDFPLYKTFVFGINASF